MVADTRPLFVRAALGLPVERTPVWAMRQAGRWDPEFQALRKGWDFFAFSENAELSARASLCPLRFGVDAIILFYDITTLAVAMGQPFALEPNRGPVPDWPIRTLADVERLTDAPDTASFRHILDTFDLVRRELGEEFPILVFAGAPFTLATYQVGTGKDLARTRTFIREQEPVWRALLNKTAAATAIFLGALMERGAAAYQLFDSWAGELTESEYEAFAQPYHQQIFADRPELSILFVKDCPYLERMAASGAKILSLSTCHRLDSLRDQFPKIVFQGNVDHMLLVTGTPQEVELATLDCLDQGKGDRHILNLDHGMDRAAQVANFEAFVKSTKKRQWVEPQDSERLFSPE